MSDYGPKAIRYIGQKAPKKDTVTRSGTIWAGHNDVQLVPHDVAVKLLQFPTVWVEAEKAVAEEVVKENPGTAQKKLEAGLETEPQNTAPTTEQIVEAIEKMDSDNPEHVTPTGLPRKAVAEEILGQSISKGEFSTAIKAIKAASEAE